MSTTVELRVHPDLWQDEAALRRLAVREAGLREDDVRGVRILRRAIDARRGQVRLQLRIALDRFGDPEADPDPVGHVPALPSLQGEPEVVIVGAGPAGLFCAWQLATHGIRSRVLERGRPVRARRRDLAALTRHGILDPDSNYCFGEGGAGTFSDGKLYTRSQKRGAIQTVLDVLVAHGASPEILVDARPHIGTNRLPGVISTLRQHLEAAGVEFVFECRVDGLRTRDGRVAGVELRGGSTIDARYVAVAPGHSARDVPQWCHRAGAAVEFKPFAMGVRIEHAQRWIDRRQYGELAGHPALGAASYRVVERVDAVGVFSFCMCPGGFIAPAATEQGGQVVNGWSPSSRGGKYANSGFVAEVDAAYLHRLGLDPRADPFVGVVAQRRLEELAYAAGGGAFVAPAQRLADFLAGRRSQDLPECSYPRGLRSVALDEVLGDLTRPLREALRALDRKMPGFAGPEAVAVGVESRTSCPVRIVRDETLQSPSLPGLFPVGEGAGYAGGIMSAALDGMRVADEIARLRASRSDP